MSKHLFGNEDAMGKVVTLNQTGINPAGNETGSTETTYGQFIITGILQNNPAKQLCHSKCLPR
jgi:hypothetical protein